MIEKLLPDGKTVTAYPLTIPQQFMLGCSLQYGQGYLINNIGSGYYWQGEMDFDVMKKSVYEAIGRCDTMRLRFTRDEKFKVLQYVTPDTQLEIETLDLSDISLEEAHEKLKEITHGPVPMFDCELHMIKLVKLAQGYNGLLFKLQHLAMDAYSTKVFLKDIMEIYLHYIKGTPYPKPMRPYAPAVMTELSYMKSQQYEVDKKYWYDSLATTSEPIFTDYLLDSRLKKQREKIPGCRYCDIHSGSPEAGLEIFDFSAQETQQITDMCEQRGLSVCAVLSMGIRTALSVFNDNEQDVSFKMIVNRRGNLAEKKSGGIRINFFPMRSIISPETSFSQAVNEIANIQNEIYSHCSLSFMEMLALRHKSMPDTALADSTYDSVGFSYQPLMIIPNLDEHTAKTAKGVWYNNGASMIPLYITARHRAADGGLEFVFEYRKTPDPSYDLQVFFKKLHDSLMLGAANPDITVGEILKSVAVTSQERNGK